MHPPSWKLVLLRVAAITFALGVLSCQVIRKQKQANEGRAEATAASPPPVYSGGTKWGPIVEATDASRGTRPTGNTAIDELLKQNAKPGEPLPVPVDEPARPIQKP